MSSETTGGIIVLVVGIGFGAWVGFGFLDRAYFQLYRTEWQCTAERVADDTPPRKMECVQYTKGKGKDDE